MKLTEFVLEIGELAWVQEYHQPVVEQTAISILFEEVT